MAEQQIVGRDGSVSVISEGYGFGSVSVGPPERPDDPTRWHSPRVDEEALCKRYGMSAEAFRALQGDHPLAFPKAASTRERRAFGAWTGKTIREYDERRVTEWEHRIRALAAQLPRE